MLTAAPQRGFASSHSETRSRGGVGVDRTPLAMRTQEFAVGTARQAQVSLAAAVICVMIAPPRQTSPS